MKRIKRFMKLIAATLILLLTFPAGLLAQEPSGKQAFSQGQLEQILAPIALYPDDVLVQILIASTYPIEVVQADRWIKQNSGLKGNALTSALEQQSWDPSVKSLVNFPQVLAMMSEKLDWTQNLGDAFLAQQEDVMRAVQNLRAKANAAGNLKTTKEQKVIVEKETIIIQPATPQVVYVPTYNPTVVYGTWAYPAYPPVYYYPPGYVATTAFFSFAAGVAIGAAWGYAWGNCNWGHGSINYNINQNININRNINRNAYINHYQGGRGSGAWQHNPTHRKGVAYNNQAVATRYNKGASPTAVRSRESYRGHVQYPHKDLGRPAAGQTDRRGIDTMQRPSTGQRDISQRSQRDFSGGTSAFEGMDRGASARQFSNRGSFSRQGMSRGGSSGSFGGARSGGRRR